MQLVTSGQERIGLYTGDGIMRARFLARLGLHKVEHARFAFMVYNTCSAFFQTINCPGIFPTARNKRRRPSLTLNELLTRHLARRDSLDKKARESLLKDHSSGRNIIWATDDYRGKGSQAGFSDPIFMDALYMGGQLILPRVFKDTAQQSNRTRHKAEVFTPSWVCNRQNNLVDAAWFGRNDVFNRETAAGWETNPAIITFPGQKGKSWQAYVDAPRMEIACGEAPYLASRYDTVTGQEIAVSRRVGILDRKLRVVSENTHESDEWLTWARRALEACYGYEWQGDSLILARENLLFTAMDFYAERFGSTLPARAQQTFAHRISWNLWQMDALKGVIPGSCHEVTETDVQLTGTATITRPCPGCGGKKLPHNGIYCLVRDWRAKVYQRYIDLPDAGKSSSNPRTGGKNG